MKLELLDAYLSGDLRGESAAFIEAALNSDAALRESYFQQVRMDSALRVLMADEELGEVTPDQFAAGVMARLSCEEVVPTTAGRDRGFAKSVLMEILEERGLRPRSMGGWDWAKAALVAAAAVALSVFMLQSVRIDETDPGASTSVERLESFVAQITKSDSDAVWTQETKTGVDQAGSLEIPSGESGWLRPGRLSLESGVIEISFTSGARIYLEGPAVLDIERPGRAFLEKGRLTGEVPKAARGFVINTPRINLVDLGTRFGVAVEESGDTEVHVMQGVVEVSRLTGNAVPLVLREGNAVRADDRTRSDLLPIAYAGDQFSLRVHPMDEPEKSARFLHYRFDETGGPELEDSGFGMEGGPFDATLFPDAALPPRPKRSVGRAGGGLVFGPGEQFQSPPLNGISSEGSLSLAMWIRIPPRMENSGPVVLGSLDALTPRDLVEKGNETWKSLWEFSWNNDPQTGNNGAFRVRSGEADAVGSTDLRDGRWHHVAFRFVGGGSGDLPTRLHLYVDGKLEPITGFRKGPVKSGSIRRLRLGGAGDAEGSRFQGALDDVYFFPEAVSSQMIIDLAAGSPRF